MKKTRLISMLLASLALSTAAFAADAATAFSLKGQARIKKGEGYNRLAVGNGIANGDFIQVAANSTLGVKTGDGATIYFGSNSSFRLRYIPDSGPGHVEITLLGGTVSGNFNTGSGGSTIIRTAAGVVDTNGASAAVTFVPSVAGGSINLVVTGGQISFIPVGVSAAVAIPTGSAFATGAGVSRATPGELATAGALVASGASVAAATGAAGAIGATGAGASGSTANVPNLSVVSPNGEGQNQ